MRTRWQLVVDAAICLAVLGSGLVELFVPLSSRAGDGSLLLSGTQVVVVAVALWWRRTRPLTSAAVAFSGLVATDLLGPSYVLFYGQFVPIVVATYSVARHSRRPLVGAALAAATLLYADFFIEELGGAGELFFHWGVLITTFAIGSWQRATARRAEEAMRRAVRSEVEAAQRAMAAVADERARIARELHDIVAHSVTTMVVQAGAAEQVVDDDPAVARAALGTIRATGTGALAEMRRLVTMLREEDEAASLAPQPGVAGIPALVDSARNAGLDAVLDVSGEVVDLPVGLGLAAYRVVQEALTNVRRHAAATRVVVRLGYGPGVLTVDVADDGIGTADASTRGGGHGLVGMRERAALYGGSLEAGPLPGRGYRVVARLPLAAS